MSDVVKVGLLQGTPTPDAIAHIFPVQYVAKALTAGSAGIGLSTRDLSRHQFTPGDITLCRRDTKELVRWNDPVEVLMIEVPDNALRSAAEELGADKVEFHGTPYLQDPRVSAIVTAIEVESTLGNPSGRLYMDSLGQAIASAITQVCGVLRRPFRQVKGGLAPAQLRRVSEYIQDRLAHELTLVELANVAGLSRAHFSQMFHRSTGIPPHKFVTNARIARAKELLLQPELRVIDVAMACGFKHRNTLRGSSRCSPEQLQCSSEGPAEAHLLSNGTKHTAGIAYCENVVWNIPRNDTSRSNHCS